jgi:formyl-CoA transferase
VYEDRHFREHEAVAEVVDPVLGRVAMQGVVPKLSGTPGSIRTTGPELGEANEEVYGGLLGHSAEELRVWREQAVI